MSDRQIEWLRGELVKAKAAGERVICFCHQPLLKEASPRTHTLANPAPVLKALDEAGAGVVEAWICGHDHTGGYAFRNGVHHLTLPGMVETQNSTSYALIRLLADRIVVEGVGRAPRCELPYGKAPAVPPVMNDVKKAAPAKEPPAPLRKAA
jgi:3',5'-cyclic AMP phosphodiesterase CpdA